MLTFAFTALTLALFAAAGLIAYLYAVREMRTALKAHVGHSRKKLREAGAKVIALESYVERLSETVKQLMPKDTPAGFNVLNYKDRLEDRYAVRNREVNVNDKPVKVGSA